MNIMNIRKATAQDLDQILLFGAMFQEESRIYEPKLIFEMEKSRAHYDKEINNNNALIIVAVVDERIVGYQYSHIETLDYLVDHNIECTLEAIYALPEFRNQGLGKILMDYTKDWAINEKNVDRIKARVYNGNSSSEKLHLKDGFRAYNTEYLYEVKK